VAFLVQREVDLCNKCQQLVRVFFFRCCLAEFPPILPLILRHDEASSEKKWESDQGFNRSDDSLELVHVVLQSERLSSYSSLAVGSPFVRMRNSSTQCVIFVRNLRVRSAAR
jgi:hypothetical protein